MLQIPRIERTLFSDISRMPFYFLVIVFYSWSYGQSVSEQKKVKSYLRGSISTDFNHYYKTPFSPLQEDNQASILIAGEYKLLKNKFKFTLQPHIRLDVYDSYRTHVDLRNLYFSYWNKNFSLNTGIRLYTLGKFAGFSLVDILNQRDFREPIMAFEKLGQPSVDVKYIYKKWNFETYVSPYLRSVDFDAPQSRLLLAPFTVSSKNEIYDNDLKEFLPNVATRIGTKWKNNELVLGYFYGYNKNPDFVFEPSKFTFVESYVSMSQFSLEWQTLFKGFTFTTETTNQTYKNNDNYWAFHGAIGYDLSKLYRGNSSMKLNVEYVYDRYRIKKSLPFGENFITLYDFNLGDIRNTTFSTKIFSSKDLSYHFFDMQLSRRFYDEFKISSKYSFSVGSLEPNEPLFFNDFNTLLAVEIGWYF